MTVMLIVSNIIYVRGLIRLIILWLFKENKELRDENMYMYLLYIFPPELHIFIISLF
jgi:hypothetical protein